MTLGIHSTPDSRRPANIRQPSLGLHSGLLEVRVEGRVLGQAEISAGSLKITGNAIAAANYKPRLHLICKTEARLELGVVGS